jgi:glucose/arabinose dehydrogenase
MKINRRQFLQTGLVASTALSATALSMPALSANLTMPSYRIEAIATGLRHPWGMCFLPNERMFITERGGRLRLLDHKKKTLSDPLKGLPKIHHENQGGLLDVQISPNFHINGEVFISFSERNDDKNQLSIAKLRWNGRYFSDYSIIFSTNSAYDNGYHFGGRIRFLPDQSLIITSGERAQRDPAQALDNHIGKILRIFDNGDAPNDNPFYGNHNMMPEIYSYGHRNPQGLAIHPTDHSIWICDHGAKGGDEVNLITAGQNYGWPVISYGRHYNGQKIGQGTSRDDVIEPKIYWDPSIAPSGLAFYQGNAFAELNGHLLIGALKYRQIRLLQLEGHNIVSQQIFLKNELGRVREILVGDDGLIYILNDEYDGGLFRIVPYR